MINVWILTVVIYSNNSITSFQNKFDIVAKCESYSQYTEKKYSNNYMTVKGICVQNQEQKINP